MQKINLVATLLITALFGVWLCTGTPTNQYEHLIQQFLPAEFRTTNLTTESVITVIKEKCKKAAKTKNETFNVEIDQSANELMTCLSSLGNLNALKAEIALARPIGELDTVFEKYCDKIPQAEQCLLTFKTKLQSCLSAAEQTQYAVLLRSLKRMSGFLCAKNGQILSLFIAEEGPECLEANKDAITRCASSSFAEYILNINNGVKNVDVLNLPDFKVQPQHCIDLERFESCSVHHLEQCRQTTTANIADSMFRFIKNETSCKQLLDTHSRQQSVLKSTNAASMSLPVVTLLTPLIMLSLSGVWRL